MAIKFYTVEAKEPQKPAKPKRAAGRPKGEVTFDRKAYMREYMRNRRAKRQSTTSTASDDHSPPSDPQFS